MVDDLAAGDFSPWLTEVQAAIRNECGADVPCHGCTACCTSSQFIHIGPDETDTLAHIPAELLFPAPRLPAGHVVLGYDEQGHCPMLIDNSCSIYAHRPRTCRSYDCRVFPATGLHLDDDDKVMIAGQARRWRFTYPTPADRCRQDAVRAAATYLQARQPPLPMNTTQLAVLAIEMHDLFLVHDEKTNVMTVVDPDPDVLADEVIRRRGDQRTGGSR